MAIPFIKETVVYQLSKRFYQLPKSVDSEKKTKGKKSLPTKKLVTQRQSSPQPRINPAFRQKVRKTDGRQLSRKISGGESLETWENQVLKQVLWMWTVYCKLS